MDQRQICLANKCPEGHAIEGPLGRLLWSGAGASQCEADGAAKWGPGEVKPPPGQSSFLCPTRHTKAILAAKLLETPISEQQAEFPYGKPEVPLGWFSRGPRGTIPGKGMVPGA